MGKLAHIEGYDTGPSFSVVVSLVVYSCYLTELVRDSRARQSGSSLRSPRGRPPTALFGPYPVPGRDWLPTTPVPGGAAGPRREGLM